MLTKLVKRLEDHAIDYHIIDDGSDFNLSDLVDYWKYTRFMNGGKKKFWVKFAHALEIVKKSKYDNFLFMPDDFEDIDIPTLQRMAKSWYGKGYALNIINDGREGCWGHYRKGIKPIDISDNNKIVEVGFCDCGFLTNRASLEQIEMDPIPESWFNRPDKSSGVGHQLTMKFRELGIPMLKPLISLATHGEHPSVMHGDHRKDVKLKSK